MKILRYFIFLLIGLTVLTIEGKKVKNSLKIEKESKVNKSESQISGREIILADTLSSTPAFEDLIKNLTMISFSGYDKEPNSNLESFFIVNPSGKTITGMEVRIDYLDMQNRMIHSRTIKDNCYVPAGETRRFDFKSWDTQHTYYYYLGNEPKRVATPFKVKIKPISYWIEE